MNKPADWDSIPETIEFKPIGLGGHKMEIKHISRNERSGYVIYDLSLDTSSDDVQPLYFTEAYYANTKENKRWGCIFGVFVNDSDGNTNRSFKAFITSIEKSNPGFSVPWGADQTTFIESFRGKSIGAVFGEREFFSSNGAKKMMREVRYIRSTDGITEVGIPAPKLLPETAIKASGFVPLSQAPAMSPNAAMSPSATMPPNAAMPILTDDEDLPF